MAEREVIAPGLAARVLFASDKTCCVCRLERTKVQIHHIDSNPANNAFENLAVICLNCHSDAHSKGAFVRNLTPELIRLYNDSWRQSTALRLLPQETNPARTALLSEVYTEVSLACHGWKIHFMLVVGMPMTGGKPGDFRDVWEAMLELWIPKYSVEMAQKTSVLFDQAIVVVQQRVDRIAALYADVIPYDFRATLLRAHRQLNTERETYGMINEAVANPALGITPESLHRGRFVGTIQVLAAVAREAQSRRELLGKSDSPAA